LSELEARAAEHRAALLADLEAEAAAPGKPGKPGKKAKKAGKRVRKASAGAAASAATSSGEAPEGAGGAGDEEAEEEDEGDAPGRMQGAVQVRFGGMAFIIREEQGVFPAWTSTQTCQWAAGT